jgi:hypothetical protein
MRVKEPRWIRERRNKKIKREGKCKRKKAIQNKMKKKGKGSTDISLSHASLNSQEKLFCQTFLQNGFSFTSESASPTQPQLELPQPQSRPCQTNP